MARYEINAIKIFSAQVFLGLIIILNFACKKMQEDHRSKYSSGKSGKEDYEEDEDADTGAETSGTRLVAYDNGRLSCGQQRLKENRYAVRCDIQVVQPDGSQKLARGVAKGHEVSWEELKSKSGMNILKCDDKIRMGLSRVCEIEIASSQTNSIFIVENFIRLVHPDKNKPPRMEQYDVALPYFIGVIAGKVNSIPYEVEFTSGQDRPSFINKEYSPFDFGIENSSFCFVGDKLFYSDKGIVYQYDKVSKKVILFAGSPVFRMDWKNSSSMGVEPLHRQRVSFDPSDAEDVAIQIACGEKKLFVAARSLHMIFAVSISPNLPEDQLVYGFAGQLSQSGMSGDGGPALNAKLHRPQHLVVGKEGGQEVLFVADQNGTRIRKIGVDGKIQSILGGGSNAASTQPREVRLNQIQQFYVSNDGSIYIAEKGGHTVRKFSGGKIEILAGKLNIAGTSGPSVFAKNSVLDSPSGLAFDENTKSLFIADTANNCIRKISPANQLEAIAGVCVGKQSASLLFDPVFLNFYGEELFYSEIWSGLISSLNVKDSTIYSTPVVGSLMLDETVENIFYSETTDARDALFGFLIGIAQDSGDYFVADFDNHHLRKISKTANGYSAKIIAGPNLERRKQLFASGNDYNGLSGDGGPALQALFDEPAQIAIDSQKNIYIADSNNKRIRRLKPNGENYNVDTIIGGGTKTSGTLIKGLELALERPITINVAPDQTLFISDYATGKIWRAKENTDGFWVEHFSGSPPNGFILGTSPTKSKFDGIVDLVALNKNEILVADQENGILRNIFWDGVLYKDIILSGDPKVCNSKIEPCSVKNYGDGGPALQAKFDILSAIALDSLGNIYIADAGQSAVRMINAKTKIISTIFGGTQNNDCGIGIISKRSAYSVFDANFLESTKSICAINPISLSVKDNCSQNLSTGTIDLLITQSIVYNSSVVKVSRPCHTF